MSYDRFVDDRLLTSRDVLNRKQVKIKLLDYDESARDFSQRFGTRILVRKVLLTIKKTDTEELEKRIRKERLWSSSNRWIAKSEIKNGYIVASRHLDLLSNAIALDIIKF
jgi:hypothetical protein